jgi:hypothetical protein
MSVYVKLANVLAPRSALGDPETDEYMDGSAVHYAYEVLPGGALAVLEFVDEQVRTEVTYAAAAWLTVGGKRRGDQR